MSVLRYTFVSCYASRLATFFSPLQKEQPVHLEVPHPEVLSLYCCIMRKMKTVNNFLLCKSCDNGVIHSGIVFISSQFAEVVLPQSYQQPRLLDKLIQNLPANHVILVHVRLHHYQFQGMSLEALRSFGFDCWAAMEEIGIMTVQLGSM